eukprot:scpid101508/ scgid29632/ 
MFLFTVVSYHGMHALTHRHAFGAMAIIGIAILDFTRSAGTMRTATDLMRHRHFIVASRFSQELEPVEVLQSDRRFYTYSVSMFSCHNHTDCLYWCQVAAWMRVGNARCVFWTFIF